MAKILRFLSLLMLLLPIIVTCSPQPTPTPAPILPPAGLQPLAAPSTLALRPEDVAWTEVVRAAKKEGGLTLYTVYFPGDWGTEMSQLFAKSTGLRVEVLVAPGNSSVERIRTERRANSPVADVLASATLWVLTAKQEGLTQKVADIPELRDERIFRFDPRLDKDGHILTLQLNTMSPWINTTLVKPGTEPKSWRDLLKPEWKGRISMADPDTGTTPNYIFHGLTSRGKLDQSYFTALGKQELKFQPNSRLEVYGLARGEISLMFATSSNAVIPFLQEGAPLKAIDMAEGIVTYRTGGVALLQGVTHPNAARVFINWLFSKEGQSIFGKGAGSIGFREDVPSFMPPQGQFTPGNPIMMTLEDELEIAKIQRERTVSKILRGG